MSYSKLSEWSQDCDIWRSINVSFIGRPYHLPWWCGVQGGACLHHWQGLRPQVQDQQQEDVLLDAGLCVKLHILAIITFCSAGAKGWQGWGVVQEGMHCVADKCICSLCFENIIDLLHHPRIHTQSGVSNIIDSQFHMAILLSTSVLLTEYRPIVYQLLTLKTKKKLVLEMLVLLL